MAPTTPSPRLSPRSNSLARLEQRRTRTARGGAFCVPCGLSRCSGQWGACKDRTFTSGPSGPGTTRKCATSTSLACKPATRPTRRRASRGSNSHARRSSRRSSWPWTRRTTRRSSAGSAPRKPRPAACSTAWWRTRSTLTPTRAAKGVSGALLDHLIQSCIDLHKWSIHSWIFPENEGSAGLHRSRGFEKVGTFHKMAKMTYGERQGQWRDCDIYELILPSAAQPS